MHGNRATAEPDHATEASTPAKEGSSTSPERDTLFTPQEPVPPDGIVIGGYAAGESVLPFDGERLVLGKAGVETEFEHLHRYLFAAELVAGRRVLDIACGEGYGSEILAQRARSVVGVDIDEPVVETAKTRYRRRNLRFDTGTCEAIPLPLRSVDVVVSFETIEHIDDHGAFLDEVCRVMRPDGLLIISTPDTGTYNSELDNPNPHHVHELSREEFLGVLRSRFKHVRLLGQRVAFGSLLIEDDASRFELLSIDSKTKSVRARGVKEFSVFWIAVASDCPLPTLPTGLYQGDALPNPISSLKGGIQERDTQILSLRAELGVIRSANEEAHRHLNQLNDAKATLASVQEALDVQTRARESSDSKAAAAFAEADAKAAEAAAAKREAEEVSAARDAANADRAALRERIRLAQERLARRGAELEDIRDQLDEARAENDRLRDKARELPKLRQDARIAVSERDAAASKAADLEASLHAAAARIEERDGLLQSAAANAATLEDALRSAEAGVGERDRLRVELEAARATIDQFRAEAERAAALLKARANRWKLRLPGRLLARTSLRDTAALARLSVRRGPIQALRLVSQVRFLRDSEDFDQGFYLARYPDVAESGMDPAFHYVAHGAAESRDPSPAFSTASYLQRYEDVARSGRNPFVHFLQYGRAEGRTGAPTTPDVARRARDIFSASAPNGSGAGQNERAPLLVSPRWRNPSSEARPSDPYTVRPDQEVAQEAARGNAFLAKYALLSDHPDFARAAADLAASRPTLKLAGPGETPDASVIIPIYGQLAYTLNCLDALLSHASFFSAEIIIVDDCSQDASRDHLSKLNGVKYHRSARNAGFVASCNMGAQLARGRHVVFLNNDTRVVAGWLDELVGAFEVLPNAGLVGSKLFYPDGSLQEAGGILWQDGSAWNYGRNDDPNKPEYCCAREVDYVSGASIALPAALWRKLGGFDDLYRPAYCEDSDLALRVRHAAQKAVWMQPLSRVIHYEGKTSGTDPTRGAKAYQIANSQKLKKRWAGTLAGHRPSGVDAVLEKDRGCAKRALIIDATTPTPDKDAGSVTATLTLRLYQQLGYKVHFAPEGNFLYLRPYTADLQRLGVECAYAPYSHPLEAVLKKHGPHLDVVQVYRMETAERAIPLVRRHAPQAAVLFHLHDLHFRRLEREAEISGDADKRARAQELRARELAISNAADCAILHSPVEQEFLARELPGLPAVVWPYMTDIADRGPDFAERRDYLFLGGFGHTPNVDSALFFVREIWPLLRSRTPGAKFHIVGANAPREVRALADADILVHGWLDDLKPAFDAARVFLAPLRYGAGVKGKIATAMAHGLPVVGTTIALEGMGYRDGEHVLQADAPQAFATAAARLYTDDLLWKRLSIAGHDIVAKYNSVEAGLEALKQAIDIAARRRATRTPHLAAGKVA